MIKISIDAMGGDHGLGTTVPAAIEYLQQQPKDEIVLVGDEDEISSSIKSAGKMPMDRLSIRHAAEVVTMDDSPAYALRKIKDSSMRVAINLVKEGFTHACVSAGNTGALMATARFVLRTIPGIDRPAICAALPRINGHTYMLDLGANVDVRPEILLQFGLMGSQMVECLDGKSDPTVALLNIGVEEMKGNDAIKATAELFKSSRLNYTGFIEADEIYLGETDLIVCDGILGNIALKASEGVAQMIMGVLKEEFRQNAITKLRGAVAKPVLNSFRQRLDHRRFNGASLLGLQGTVIKSHGGTDPIGFMHAIEVAAEEARNDLVNRIQGALTGHPLAAGAVG